MSVPDMWVSAAAELTGWLLTYWVHSTLLIGAVWALCSARPESSPELRDLLWKVALVGATVTATGAIFGSPAGQQEVAVFAHLERVSVEAPAAGGPVERAPTDVSSAGGQVARALTDVSSAVWWHYGLLGLWLLGALFGMVRLGSDHRRLRALRLGFQPAGPRTLALFERLARGVRARVQVRVSGGLDAPCVVDRRTIVLPERCERDLSDEELEAVLAHELAHVIRRDVAWLEVGRWASALLWLQPLNRVALRGSVEAAELVCDDWALTRTGHRLGLARSISRVAEWSVGGRGLPSAVVAMVGRDGRSLSGRVRRILRGTAKNGPPRWKRLLAAAVLCAPMLLLPAVPGPPVVHRSVFVRGDGVEMDAIDDAVRLLDRYPEGLSSDRVERRVLVRVERP